MIPELEQIKRILLDQWDPIGVAGTHEAADEYDSYAFRVFTSLHSGATADAINEYLRSVETEHMGLSATTGRSEDVARKVFAIHHGRTET